MRIILADDHMLFRVGLRLVLKQILGTETEFLEADGFAGLMALLRDEPPADVVISELLMPAEDPFDALRAAVERANGVPVIIVSSSQDRDHILRSMACGARGYLAKHDEPRVLRYVIELILHGGRYIPPQALIEPGNNDRDPAASPPTPTQISERRAAATADGSRWASRLTKRQAVIWLLLAEGQSNKEIARRLALAESTVKSQVKSIYRRLGVRNRTQAALLAVGEADDDEPSDIAPQYAALAAAPPSPDRRHDRRRPPATSADGRRSHPPGRGPAHGPERERSRAARPNPPSARPG